MRDTFYCWLIMLMASSISFGSSVERAKNSDINWFDIGMATLFAVMSVVSLRAHYRAAALARKDGEPVNNSNEKEKA